ncbi:MAG: hypothetical protein M3323_13470 [Actinomycetota bacterium]|nr:hypothetical protein [Actinomycetota bacterium]
MRPNEERVERLRDALAAVQELDIPEDSPMLAPALEFLLKSLDQSGPDERHVNEAGLPTSETGSSSPLERAVTWTGVSPEALLDVVDFGTEGVIPTVYHGRLPKGKLERQRVVAVMKLSLDKVAYGASELSARQVNEVCDRYECLDQNLPGNLQKSGLATRLGDRGSYVYRVTLAGEDRARQVLRSLTGTDVGAADQ